MRDKVQIRSVRVNEPQRHEDRGMLSCVPRLFLNGFTATTTSTLLKSVFDFRLKC